MRLIEYSIDAPKLRQNDWKYIVACQDLNDLEYSTKVGTSFSKFKFMRTAIQNSTKKCGVSGGVEAFCSSDATRCRS